MQLIEDKIRILIVDDEPLICDNLEMYLNTQDYTVVGKAYDYEDGINLFLRTEPDLVLLDINFEDEMDGINLAEWILKIRPLPIIYLTSYSDKETIERAKKTMPQGYLVKPFNEQSLITTIEIALTNFATYSNKGNSQLNLEKLNLSIMNKLTNREFEILQKIYNGLTNQQICNELYIAFSTLKTHINHAYLKLDVQTRSEAMAKLRNFI
jgi:two-component system, response regulator PdtaR